MEPKTGVLPLGRVVRRVVLALTGLTSTISACSAPNEAGEDTAAPVDVQTVSEALSMKRPAAPPPVGLSLWWQEGKVRLFSGAEQTVDLYEDFPRYLEELDITAQAETPTDEGIEPIIDSGDMAGLDWRGVEQTDEDWRPEGNSPPTYTRSRFFRGARWMKRPSLFALVPVDETGHVVGAPISKSRVGMTTLGGPTTLSCVGFWRAKWFGVARPSAIAPTRPRILHKASCSCAAPITLRAALSASPRAPPVCSCSGRKTSRTCARSRCDAASSRTRPTDTVSSRRSRS